LEVAGAARFVATFFSETDWASLALGAAFSGLFAAALMLVFPVILGEASLDPVFEAALSPLAFAETLVTGPTTADLAMAFCALAGGGAFASAFLEGAFAALTDDFTGDFAALGSAGLLFAGAALAVGSTGLEAFFRAGLFDSDFASIDGLLTGERCSTGRAPSLSDKVDRIGGKDRPADYPYGPNSLVIQTIYNHRSGY
jgi:hypothetical protein